MTLNIFGAGAADGSRLRCTHQSNHRWGWVPAFFGQHGHLACGYQIPALNPTDSQYSFNFCSGYNAAWQPSETILLADNLQITVVSNTNPYPNPPPSGTNTTAPYFNNPPISQIILIPTSFAVTMTLLPTTTTFIDITGLLFAFTKIWCIEVITISFPTAAARIANATNGVQNYRNGVFASSIRYYNGTFYVVDQLNGQPIATIFSSQTLLAVTISSTQRRRI